MSRCLALSASALVSTALCICPAVEADTLEEVLRSEAMQKLENQTQNMYRAQNRRAGPGHHNFLIGIDPNSEFARVWQTSRGPELLLNWLGVSLPQYTAKSLDTSRNREYVYAGSTLMTRARERVVLEVLIPHPTFHTMVHFKTLRAFNVYEPPALDTIAQEQLNFRQVSGMYYRTRRGQC